jgi:hypothetical protein
MVELELTQDELETVLMALGNRIDYCDEAGKPYEQSTTPFWHGQRDEAKTLSDRLEGDYRALVTA